MAPAPNKCTVLTQLVVVIVVVGISQSSLYNVSADIN